MVVGANSYGSAAQVAALTPRWANSETIPNFDGATKPTLITVEDWIDKVSAIVNAILADEGFAVPVTDADVILILEGFIEQEVAAVVEGINGIGRFGPTAKTKGAPKGRWQLVMEDARDFIIMLGTGLEKLGATRERGMTDGTFYRDVDDAGDTIHPMFQRKGFGWVIHDSDQG